MTETEYLNTYYPQDFICIQDDFSPLPKGGKIDIEYKQISSVFTTADGSKRKDIIRTYNAVSIKFSILTQNEFERICEVITKIDNAFYDESKYLFLKKENMPIPPQNDFKTFFTAFKIDIVHPIKYSHSFRKNSEFLYSGITLKLN